MREEKRGDRKDRREPVKNVTGMFTLTGSMNADRSSFTATLLNNGMVLVAGGDTSLFGSGILASAELYDPATGTFTLTGTMNSARAGHTATLLNNGVVLVAGGFGDLGSAESYDPATGLFTATGSMNAGRSSFTATLLNNGMVLVAGPALASAELYELVVVLPTSLSFSNQAVGTTSASQTVKLR
jgi:hypothetical protein